MSEQLKAGDRVRFTGTAKQDIYHGELVGKEGIAREYCGVLWLEAPTTKPDSGGIGLRWWSVNQDLLERA